MCVFLMVRETVEFSPRPAGPGRKDNQMPITFFLRRQNSLYGVFCLFFLKSAETKLIPFLFQLGPKFLLFPLFLLRGERLKRYECK